MNTPGIHHPTERKAILTPVSNITTSSTLDGHQVDCSEDRPSRLNILYRLRDLMYAALAVHWRVLFVRFDLHFPVYSSFVPDNNAVEKYAERLRLHLFRAGCGPFYLWVREQYESPHQHYHFVLLLDAEAKDAMLSLDKGSRLVAFQPGDEMHHLTACVLNFAQRSWVSSLGAQGLNCGKLFHRCGQPTIEYPLGNGVVIDQEALEGLDMFRECLYRGSYLAKCWQKGLAADGGRELGSSQLPAWRPTPSFPPPSCYGQGSHLPHPLETL